MVGAIPAAFLAQRYGLRNCLVATIASTAVIEAARAMIGAELPLAALAFFSGLVFALWAVILTPIVAGTVDARRRPTAFSLFFASQIAIGIAGGWLGGRLAIWMHGKKPVLLLSAALAAVAVAPALRLNGQWIEWPMRFLSAAQLPTITLASLRKRFPTGSTQGRRPSSARPMWRRSII